MKIKVPGKNKKLSTVSSGTVNPIHTVKSISSENGQEEIDLSNLHGWDELTVQKQRYLVAFSKNNLKEKRAAVSIGVDTGELNQWKKQDPIFVKIFNDIIDIHVEGVEEANYVNSYHKSGDRGRFLKHRSDIYKKEPEESSNNVPRIGTQNNQTNILAVLNSEDTKKEGLAGVQKVFNEMKEQGSLPLPENDEDDTD